MSDFCELQRPPAQSKYFPVFGTALYLTVYILLLCFLNHSSIGLSSHIFLLGIGFIPAWRYSWQLVHVTRMMIYRYWHFPKLRATADALAEKSPAPEIFVVITSYKMDVATSIPVYRALFQEAIDYGAPVTIVAAVTDAGDEDIIERIFKGMSPNASIQLVLMRQAGTGKRDAMAAALRAVSRRSPPPGSIVVLMDGDTMLKQGTIRRCASFFPLLPNVGGVTVDNCALTTGSPWVKAWYDLRLAQRHIHMSSLSLSRRLLVLTGRFSMFRAEIAMKPSFIDILENDSLEHWRYGKFNFLTGDDKSTWFWLLKHGYEMLYVPDVDVVCFESLPRKNFIKGSTLLMTRWFGNMLRNNSRSVAQGPRRSGFFAWMCLLDQRCSMWTSLVGISSASCGAILFGWPVLIAYLAWLMTTRLVYTMFLYFMRKQFSPCFPVLLIYNQIVGSLIKIHVSFRLNRQKWTRQAIHSRQADGIRATFQNYWTIYLNVTALIAFLLAIAAMVGLISLPNYRLISHADAATESTNILSGNDIQTLINRTPSGQTVYLAPGVYTLSQGLLIERGNFTLQGAGIGKTVLRASFGGHDDAVIKVKGQLPSETSSRERRYLAKSINPNDNTFYTTAPLQAAPGDIIAIRAANDDAFLSSIDSKRWHKTYPYVRQTMAQIKAIEGNRVIVTHSLGVPFPINAQVSLLKVLKNVTIRNMTIQYDLGMKPNPTEYEDVRPDNAVDGIQVEGAFRPRIENVRILTAGRHAVNLDTVLEPDLRNIYAQDVWNKGKGGNGYFRLARTYYGQFNSLHLRGLRHLTIQWSSHDNKITHLDADCDVNFHGGYAQHNSVQFDYLEPRPGHLWGQVTHTANNAHWAPPDGAGNIVLNSQGKIVQ